MYDQQERQSDGGVSLRHHPPRQILCHAVVFVLAGTIIGVEEGVLLSKAMMVKKLVQPTDHSICTLATISCFIRQEVYLPGECLTVDTKHSAIPGSQKVDGARLLRVRWIAAKGGVCHMMNGALNFSCFVIHLPDPLLRSAGWKKLEVITDVPWNPPRKE